MTACRPILGSSVKEMYSFEVLSVTEWNIPGVNNFSPSVFVNLNRYIDVKVAALEAYSEEMRCEPHSRSIENSVRLSQVRGSSVG